MVATAKTYLQIVQEGLRRAGYDPTGVTSSTFTALQQDVELIAKDCVLEVIQEIYDKSPLYGWDFALTKSTYSWPAATNEVALTTLDDSLTGIDINNIKAVFLSSTYSYQQLTPMSYQQYLKEYERGNILTTVLGTPKYYTVLNNNLVIWPCYSDTITIHYQPEPALPSAHGDLVTSIPAYYHDVLIYGVAAKISEHMGDPMFESKARMYQLGFQRMLKKNRDFGREKRIHGGRLYYP